MNDAAFDAFKNDLFLVQIALHFIETTTDRRQRAKLLTLCKQALADA
jgi:hypothetical protein